MGARGSSREGRRRIRGRADGRRMREERESGAEELSSARCWLTAKHLRLSGNSQQGRVCPSARPSVRPSAPDLLNLWITNLPAPSVRPSGCELAASKRSSDVLLAPSGSRSVGRSDGRIRKHGDKGRRKTYLRANMPRCRDQMGENCFNGPERLYYT